MSRWERTGRRDMTYSVWHRSLPWELSFLDVDWMERCDACKRVLCIYELAIDDGRQDDKDVWATARLARQAGVPGYLVLYRLDASHAIAGFRVRRVTEPTFVAYTPDEWAARLVAMRTCCGVRRTTDRAPASPPHGASRAGDAPPDAPRCATCGSAPSHRFPDGSPAFACSHPARVA